MLVDGSFFTDSDKMLHLTKSTILLKDKSINKKEQHHHYPSFLKGVAWMCQLTHGAVGGEVGLDGGCVILWNPLIVAG